MKPSPLVRVTTINTDYAKADPADRVRQLVDRLATGCDVLLVQEAKRVRLAELLPVGWLTMQRARSAAVRGSAVCWSAPLPSPHRARLRLGALPTNGRKVARMLPRWVAVLDTELNGVPVTFVSAHWPPLRYDYLWAQMDRRVARLIARKIEHGRAVILGGDMNCHPAIVAARLNRHLPQAAKVTAHGDHRIDGFLLAAAGGVTLSAAVRIDRTVVADGLTDHPAVSITLKLGLR